MENKQEAKLLDLIGIVAHELKSPVATIHTTVDTLHGGYFGELTLEQLKGLETVIRNCQYLEDIIRCFSDLSQIELGSVEFKQAAIDLVNDVVETIVRIPEYQCNLKGMRIVRAYSDVPPVLGDARLLRIVFNNILNNAVKYGNPDSDIIVKVASDGDFALVTIYNEGPGMTPEDIENRLFKRFERLRQTGTEGVKGSGLGLYICKQIVEKHGGRIEAHSDPESFAEFRVALKLA